VNRKLIFGVLLIIALLLTAIFVLTYFLVTQLANLMAQSDYKSEISHALKEHVSESQRHSILERAFNKAQNDHVSSENLADMYFQVGDFYWVRGEADRALPSLKKSADLFEKIGVSGNRGSDGEAASLTAMCEHYADKKSSDSLHYAQLGLAAKKKLYGDAAPTTAHAEIAYGLACFDNNDLRQARMHLERAEAIIDKAKPRTFRDPRPRFLRYWALAELASVDAAEHHLDQAQEEFKEAMNYADDCFGAGSARAELLLCSYSRALDDAGYKKESEFYKSKLDPGS
jgi:tetratricopeptide (TPR) repeat protein